MTEDDPKFQNPVAQALRRRIEGGLGNTDLEQLVLRYGRPFLGMERPTGYRLRAKKNCFLNSFGLADRNQGVYVEGFALCGPGGPFQHAWITIDGIHAVDVTLRGSIPDCQFFGVPFPTGVLWEAIEARKEYFPLLDYAEPMHRMETLLQKASCFQISFQF